VDPQTFPSTGSLFLYLYTLATRLTNLHVMHFQFKAFKNYGPEDEMDGACRTHVSCEECIQDCGPEV